MKMYPYTTLSLLLLLTASITLTMEKPALSKDPRQELLNKKWSTAADARVITDTALKNPESLGAVYLSLLPHDLRTHIVKEIFNDTAIQQDIDRTTEQINQIEHNAKELRDLIEKRNLEELEKKLQTINPNVKDRTGYTALHMAAWRWDIAAIDLLLEKGADINVCNDNGGTPLHTASSCHSPNDVMMTRYLLAHGAGASINTQTNEGIAPLFYAAHNFIEPDNPQDQADLVAVLLEYGADVTVKGPNNKYPYNVTKNPLVKELLLKAWEKKLEK